MTEGVVGHGDGLRRFIRTGRIAVKPASIHGGAEKRGGPRAFPADPFIVNSG
jgi:hypothetical protein